MRHVKAVVLYLLCNGAGLLLASALLAGFRISWGAFVVAVILMSVALAVIAPVVRKIAEKRAPQLMGGIALVAILLSLVVTSLVVPGVQISGLAAWIGGTVLVWLGSLVASFLLPSLVFRDRAGPASS